MRSEYSITIRINFAHAILTDDDQVEAQVRALLQEAMNVNPLYRRTHVLRDWNGHIVGEVQVV